MTTIQKSIAKAIDRDALRLWALERMERTTGALESRHNRTQQRMAENAKIAAAEARGEGIAVVWGGMDCDCVRYSGDVTIIQIADLDRPYATDKDGNPFRNLRAAVDAHIEHTYHWADGPCHHFICSIEEAGRINYDSRDLAMEAFEDGHQHVVYS